MAFVPSMITFSVGFVPAKLLSKDRLSRCQIRGPTLIHVVCSVRLGFGVRISVECKVQSVEV